MNAHRSTTPSNLSNYTGVFGTQAPLMPAWPEAAPRAEAMKSQKMAAKQRISEAARLQEVRQACPEKYTTECIEGSAPQA